MLLACVAATATSCNAVFRVRVGGWRILYSHTADALRIEAIGSRADVYKRG